MNEVARELRDLASRIEELVRESSVMSMAMPATKALTEYLTLRARVMELESERQ
jgi:hypothetical protein